MNRILFVTNFAALAVAFATFGSSASADMVLEYTFDSGVEGFTQVNVDSFGASGGRLTGTAASNDPQLRRTGIGVALMAGFEWTTLEYRVREFNDGGGAISFANASNTQGLVFGFNFVGNSVTPADYTFTNVVGSGGFTDVSVDISGLGSATLNSFRLDPIGGSTEPNAENNPFELEFVRFNASPTAVPEPTSLLLVGIAGFGAAFQRRRRR